MKLFIASPSYDGRLHYGYVAALLGTIDVLREQDIAVRWLCVPGQSLLPAARAKLVAVFLAEASCSHLLMVDAEVEWLPDDIVRLIIHDRGQLSVGQAQKAGNIP